MTFYDIPGLNENGKIKIQKKYQREKKSVLYNVNSCIKKFYDKI